MNELFEQVQNSISAHQLLQRGESVIVAVSGGLDSMVLLRVLHSLSTEHEWKLHVAHFNHLLRGDASDADEALVKEAAREMSLSFRSERANVREFAAGQNLSIEMAARQLRHQFFAKVAMEQGVGNVALAHHADDQVELFFLRLLRGTSLSGLAGMAWSSPSSANPDIQLIRPLLGCSKAALREYASSQRIQFREDSTNESLDILRNRIRHELLPLLTTQYQPAIADTTLRLMDIIRAESQFVDSALGSHRDQRFGALPIALQRRLIEAQLIGLAIDPNFALIEHLRRSNAPIMLQPKTVLTRDANGRLHLESTDHSGFDSEQLVVSLAGQRGVFCFKDVSFEWEITEKAPPSSPSPLNGERAGVRGESVRLVSSGAEVFDSAKIGDSIVLRHWQPGDRFQPIGMPQAVKLQDFFTNQKVPRETRHKLLIATTNDGEIFWVEGLRISECFKLEQSTKHVLKWAWRRS